MLDVISCNWDREAYRYRSIKEARLLRHPGDCAHFLGAVESSAMMNLSGTRLSLWICSIIIQAALAHGFL